MSETKHTPTPWGYCYSGSSTWNIGAADDPQDSAPHVVIYDSNDDRALANSRFIVKAVNSHDALREALEAMTEFLRHSEWDSHSTEVRVGNLVEQARAALAQAKGE